MSTHSSNGVEASEHRTYRQGKTLLVASTGGHLEELVRLRDRIPGLGSFEWATFDDVQSRSLLAGEVVHHVGYIAPRGYGAAAQSLIGAIDIVRSGGYSHIISTGSGIAVPFFAAGRILRVSCHYIESAARSERPSMTGSVVRMLPGVRLYSQYPNMVGRRWSYGGSLFDGFETYSPAGGASSTSGTRLQRVVVTLGTMRTFGFRRAVERLVTLLPQVCAPDAEILWQTGSTDLSGLDVPGQDRVGADELRRAIAAADLVIAHAGVGTALTVLDAGHCPVLVPRLSAHDEHIDDHQVIIARALDERGLAVSRDADELTPTDLWQAAGSRVQTVGQPAPFVLDMRSRR